MKNFLVSLFLLSSFFSIYGFQASMQKKGCWWVYNRMHNQHTLEILQMNRLKRNRFLVGVGMGSCFCVLYKKIDMNKKFKDLMKNDLFCEWIRRVIEQKNFLIQPTQAMHKVLQEQQKKLDSLESDNKRLEEENCQMRYNATIDYLDLLVKGIVFSPIAMVIGHIQR